MKHENRREEILLILPQDGSRDVDFLQPPLGLLYLAAFLIEDGWKVRLLDMRVEKNWRQALARVLATKPLCVGISCLLGRQVSHGLEISAFVRQHCTAPLVWGGLQATLTPEVVLRADPVDYVVVGEGEIAFPQLVRVIAEGDGVETIGGVGYLAKGGPVINPPGPLVDLDALPRIPYGLFDLQRYRYSANPFNFSRTPFLFFETSRGCSHRCGFCSESKTNRRWRGMSPSQIIRHLRHLKADYGVSSICFVDENFFVSRRRLRNFFAELERSGLEIEWYSNVSPELLSRADEEFIQTLWRSGARAFTFGTESGSNRVLAAINKGATIEDFHQANQRLAATPIIPFPVALVNFPQETVEDLKSTLLLALKLMAENPRAVVSVNRLIPIPGTPCYEAALRAGLPEPLVLADFAKLDDERAVPFYDADCAELWRRYHYISIIGQLSLISFPGIQLLRHLLIAITRMRLRHGFRALNIEHWLLDSLLQVQRRIKGACRSPGADPPLRQGARRAGGDRC